MSNILSKQIFLAKRTGERDGIEFFSKPISLWLNVVASSGTTDIAEYGERVSKIQKAVMQNRAMLQSEIVHSIEGELFSEGDRVYLDGLKPKLDNYIEGEFTAEDSNYKVISVRNGNMAKTIYFERLQ